MQVSTNRYYDRSTSQLQGLQSQVDRLQEQISTGKKVIAPSDDAVSYQRLQTLTKTKADDGIWKDNISLAQTVLKETDATLGSISDQLQNLQEIALQATNGTLSASNRQTLAGTVQAALDSLVSLANTKDARGEPLFGGASGDTAVTVDASGAVSFTSTGTPSPIPIGNNNSVQPSETAQRIFGGLTTSSGATDTFGVLTNFVTALKSGAPIDKGVIDDLKSAFDQVTAARSAAGARSARLDIETSRLTDIATTRETERSSLEDVDPTEALIELQKTSTVLQATQASFTKLSQLSLFDYIK